MDGLTEHRPIASLPFGGKYRLIDFPLSNLANAGIRSVFGIFQNENISSVFDHIRSSATTTLVFTTPQLKVQRLIKNTIVKS